MWRLASSLVVVGLLSVPLAAQEKKAELTGKEKKAAEAVADLLAKINGGGAGITIKNEEAVRKQFPDHVIVNARYRLFPVAQRLPENMSASNLFAVDKDGKVEHLKDAKELEKFFHKNLSAVTDKGLERAVSAWLGLSQEFIQDGFYKFEAPGTEPFESTGSGDGKHLTVSTRIVVMAGGNGEIKATLTFKVGKLAKVEEVAKIRPGPRPICQATKLLDPDPLVRRICEQDLLIMGLSAREYLMEQRDRATPELLIEIDRLWRQILKNGW
jgi:hypothetical protein